MSQGKAPPELASSSPASESCQGLSQSNVVIHGLWLPGYAVED